MASKLGKVILLFIEGESDELALQPLLNGIVKRASSLAVVQNFED